MGCYFGLTSWLTYVVRLDPAAPVRVRVRVRVS